METPPEHEPGQETPLFTPRPLPTATFYIYPGLTTGLVAFMTRSLEMSPEGRVGLAAAAGALAVGGVHATEALVFKLCTMIGPNDHDR